MAKKKIFLIENQSTQFNKISIFLNDSEIEQFEVFPIKENYIRVIDYVRICLNPRYNKTNRDKAFEKLKTEFDNFNPDLIIIDHILVGNYFAQNGIDLAIKLRESNFIQPILFLSNTKPNTAEVISNFPKIAEPKEWIHKGYAGEEILRKEYFEKNVIKEIIKMHNSANIVSTSSVQKLKELYERNKLLLDKTGFNTEKKSLNAIFDFIQKSNSLEINSEIEAELNLVILIDIDDNSFANKLEKITLL